MRCERCLDLDLAVLDEGLDAEEDETHSKTLQERSATEG